MSFAIGVENLKNGTNLGTLLRSAFCFDASLVFIVGKRYVRQSSDTVEAPRHIPVQHFPDWAAAWGALPYAWEPVAVEIGLDATSLPDFKHPKNAVYILGPEDGSLSSDVWNRAARRVVIPSRRCLNVAVTASIVMYDRIAKGGLLGMPEAMKTNKLARTAPTTPRTKP